MNSAPPPVLRKKRGLAGLLLGAALPFLPALPGAFGQDLAAVSVTPFQDAGEWVVSLDAKAKASVNDAKDGRGIVVDYDLQKGVWIDIGKAVDLNLTAVRSYQLDYKLDEAANSLEMKIADASGNVYGALLKSEGEPGKWRTVTVSSASLKYWWGGKNNMDWSKVRQVSFAISQKQGDPGGKGRVTIGSLKALLPAGEKASFSPPITGYRRAKGYFRIDARNGRKGFTDPYGQPFYSMGMVYAYGPEKGPMLGRLTYDYVLQELEIMKSYGFNTLDLYGSQFLREVLNWCEAHEMAVYFRTSYTDAPGIPPAQKEFPDFMDPVFRDAAKHSYDPFLKVIKNYRCVLAVDMDERWLFSVDWSGQKRFDTPKLGPVGLKGLPDWLQKRFGSVSALNAAWGRNYRGFADVLADKDVVEDGKVKPLGENPWRIDVVEYTLWTANDFLKDLTGYMRGIDPNHMITYTSELAETIPLPLSTPQNSGIDFISPVHYNFNDDYDRDWIGNARLLAHLKYYYDLSGTPQYISETGFRTRPLAQRPPSMGYAAARPGDERHMAELYVRQASLMNVYPWLTGWSYFMWYDKWLEGDFGFIRNDRTLKPISKAGAAFNPRLARDGTSEKEPRYWLFYPRYALASPLSGFPAYKTLITLLEGPFFKRIESAMSEAKAAMDKSLDRLPATLKIFHMDKAFNESWVPFKFTEQVPSDGKPVILAGESLENLSAADREALSGKRTVAMGRIGLRDERFRPTAPWFLEAAGVKESEYAEMPLALDLRSQVNDDAVRDGAQDAPADGGVCFLSSGLPAGGFRRCGKEKISFKVPASWAGPDNVRWQGQSISVSPGFYSQLHFLLTSFQGNRTARVELTYEDGTRGEVLMGPSISEATQAPAYVHADLQGNGLVGGKPAPLWLSHAEARCNVNKKLVSIRLSNEPQLHLFAITVVKGGAAEDVPVTVRIGEKTLTGSCAWVQCVRPGANPGYRVLAKFDNGLPAVVQSLDGRHTAFLYDALGWKGTPQEMSRNTDAHAELLSKSLRGNAP